MIKKTRTTTVSTTETTRVQITGVELLGLICTAFDLDPVRTKVVVSDVGYVTLDLDGDVDVEIIQTTSRTEEIAPAEDPKSKLKSPKPDMTRPPRGAPPPPIPTCDDREYSHDDPEAQ